MEPVVTIVFLWDDCILDIIERTQPGFGMPAVQGSCLRMVVLHTFSGVYVCVGCACVCITIGPHPQQGILIINLMTLYIF